MSAMDAQTEAEALATCEAEPIRSPDRVQQHGCLLVTDPQLGSVTHVSENATDFVGIGPSEILGTRLATLLTREDAHKVRNALSLATIDRHREYLGAFVFGDLTAQAAVHLREGRVILELTGVPKLDQAVSFGLERLRWLLARPNYETPLEDALGAMTRDLRSIVGYDRVMAYRFRPDGSGEVVSEHCTPDMDSFLGLRFPSQDIPQIARAICLEQPLRIIGDTTIDDIAVLTAPGEIRPLDLTLAEVRGTSPVHTAYLRNMGVGASLVLPIIVDNRLWGVFSCHHRTPRIPAIEETMTYDLVGQMLNVTVNTILRRDLARNVADCEKITQRLQRETAARPKALFTDQSWAHFADSVIGMFRCDGLVLSSAETQYSVGLNAPERALGLMSGLLVPSAAEGVHTQDAIPSSGIDSGEVAGAMRIDLFPDPEVALWLFRREENETVKWAGSPKKEIERTPTHTRLHPRSSFEAYSEMSQGKSRAWEPDDIHLAQALQAALRRTLDRHLERDQNEKQLALMVQELNHRVRNILALIQSLASQSAAGKEDVKDYVAGLNKRLLALASAHDLLTVSDHTGLELEPIVARELTPFVSNVTSTHGPKLRLSPSASTIFVLVFHEIVTNAAKYGALSRPEGRVSLDWQVSDDMLTLLWQERGGPEIKSAGKAGFGQFLIQEAICHQLDGESSTWFQREGVEIRLSIPMRHVVLDNGAGRSKRRIDGGEPVPPSPVEDVRTAFILEDDFMVALEIKSFLLKQGIKQVAMANGNKKALAKLHQAKPDVAVLDLNLGQEDSKETATYLRGEGIPFVFLSGYSSAYDWVREFPDVPLVNKPIRPELLKEALSGVLTWGAKE